MTYKNHKYQIVTTPIYPYSIPKIMNDEILRWTHNPAVGTVIGKLMTKPEQLNFMLERTNKLIATAFIVDANKRRWRVRCNAGLAGQLLSFQVGQKIKCIGIKGDLCKGAWDNAKRQIVPTFIEAKK